MHDPEHQLLAQNDHPHTEHSTGTHQAPAKHEAPAKEEGGSPINQVFQALGDHHELTFGHIHLVNLPVILIEDGLHVYPSIEKMEADGQYVLGEYNRHQTILNATTHQPPALDLSPTSLVAFQWLAMLILAAILIPMARKYRKNGVRPLKGFFNAIESVIVYVRDEIVLTNMGEDGRKYLPVFLTIFFFILTMNIVGLVPGGHTSTGSLNTTAALAAIAFFIMQGASIKKIGIVNWVKHLGGGVPWWILPIMVPVEILGLFTKPFALAVRLFANMTAGHVILLSLIALVFVGKAFIPVTIGFSLFIYLLEILVAFLQAYIFTVLTAVFTGMGMASHDHDDHRAEGEHAHAH